MKENLDELMKKYKLPEEENNRIKEIIIKEMLFSKTPVKNPKAIFNIGPAGSGKTGLNGYGVKEFDKSNIIVINNDELRSFHPKADELARKYPEYYIKITNEESKIWTDALMDIAVEKGYNVMYEGTGRKIKIFQKMISKMNGYEITVRAMAVNECNCLMSILERYENQVAVKGWGRLVALDTFYKAYDEEMLNTVDIFEKTGMADNVEVFIRGNEPTSPVKIYNSNDSKNKYFDAKNAVIEGRKRDKENVKDYYEMYFTKTMEDLMKKDNLSNEEKEIIEKVKKLYNEILIDEKRKNREIEER